MNVNFFLMAALAVSAMAQDVATNFVRAIDPTPNSLIGYPAPTALSLQPRAQIGTTTQIFPHIATGGGWETDVVIVNMSTAPIPFTMHFYAEDGSPMQVTFSTVPQNTLVTTTAAVGNLLPQASFNFVLLDSTQNTQVGWATLDYAPSATARLGGYSIFRQRVAGRPDFEA